jgi:hypothetical protein
LIINNYQLKSFKEDYNYSKRIRMLELFLIFNLLYRFLYYFEKGGKLFIEKDFLLSFSLFLVNITQNGLLITVLKNIFQKKIELRYILL